MLCLTFSMMPNADLAGDGVSRAKNLGILEMCYKDRM